MNIATLTWFSLAAVLVFLMAQDPNVGTWLVLQFKRLNVELERRWLMFKLHPEAPWFKYRVHRRSMKLAAKILKEKKKR